MRALILVSGYLQGRRTPWPENEHEQFLARCFPRRREMESPHLLGGIGNKPMLVHQIYALKSVSVSTIYLGVDFLPEGMLRDVDQLRNELHITIEVLVRMVAYGTGGWLKLLKNIGLVDKDPFFLMRSDVIYDYLLGDMLELHNARGVEATMAITEVELHTHDITSVSKYLHSSALKLMLIEAINKIQPQCQS